MAEYYLQIKWLHIATVLISGTLFLFRGALVTLGQQELAMKTRFRYLSYFVDTILLVAALTLVLIVQQYPFIHAWLTVKVLLLLLYIVLGSFALKRGRNRKTRAMAYAAALLVYGFIISIALSHHPAGWLLRFSP